MSITGECNVTPLTPKLPRADKGVYCSFFFLHMSISHPETHVVNSTTHCPGKELSTL